MSASMKYYETGVASNNVLNTLESEMWTSASSCSQKPIGLRRIYDISVRFWTAFKRIKNIFSIMYFCRIKLMNIHMWLSDSF